MTDALRALFPPGTFGPGRWQTVAEGEEDILARPPEAHDHATLGALRACCTAGGVYSPRLEELHGNSVRLLASQRPDPSSSGAVMPDL